jgi:hypothetical protein
VGPECGDELVSGELVHYWVPPKGMCRAAINLHTLPYCLSLVKSWGRR